MLNEIREEAANWIWSWRRAAIIGAAAVIIVDYLCGGRKDYDDSSYAMGAAAEVGDGLVLNDSREVY